MILDAGFLRIPVRMDPFEPDTKPTKETPMCSRTLLAAAATAVLSAAIPDPGTAQSVDRLLPDLVVSDISVGGGEARIGNCNRAVITVSNLGRTSVPEAEVLVGIATGAPLRELYLTTGSIASGSSRRVYVNDIRVTDRLVMAAYADPNERIAEVSKSNNGETQRFSVSTYCNTFSVDDISVSEGGTATFTIQRAGPRPRENQTITYNTVDGSATGGTGCSTRGGPDYVVAKATVQFSRFDTSKTVSIQVCSDRVIESSETFHLFLSSPPFGTTFSDGKATATIVR